MKRQMLFLCIISIIFNTIFANSHAPENRFIKCTEEEKSFHEETSLVWWRFEIKKLLRDKQVELCAIRETIIRTRVLSDEDFIKELLKKLVEEAHEIQEAKDKQELMNELADLLEVYYAILKVYSILQEEIENIRNQKKDVRGSFENRVCGVYWDIPETKKAQFWLAYCRSQTEKYPFVEKIETDIDSYFI